MTVADWILIGALVLGAAWFGLYRLAVSARYLCLYCGHRRWGWKTTARESQYCLGPHRSSGAGGIHGPMIRVDKFRPQPVRVVPAGEDP